MPEPLRRVATMYSANHSRTRARQITVSLPFITALADDPRYGGAGDAPEPSEMRHGMTEMPTSPPPKRERPYKPSFATLGERIHDYTGRNLNSISYSIRRTPEIRDAAIFRSSVISFATMMPRTGFDVSMFCSTQLM